MITIKYIDGYWWLCKDQDQIEGFEDEDTAQCMADYYNQNKQ